MTLLHNRLVLAKASGSTDLEIDGTRKSVGDRRPLLDVGDERIDLALRNALALHVDLDAHVGEADRLLTNVPSAPDGGDIEIALELELELVDDPAAMHRIRVEPDGKAGTERGEGGFGRIGCRVVAQKPRRLIDDIRGKIADVVGVAEPAFGHRLAF